MYKVEMSCLEEFLQLCKSDIEGGEVAKDYSAFVFTKLACDDGIICILGIRDDNLIASFSPLAKKHVRKMVTVGRQFLDYLWSLETLIRNDPKLIRFAEFFGFKRVKNLEQIEIDGIMYMKYIRNV